MDQKYVKSPYLQILSRANNGLVRIYNHSALEIQTLSLDEQQQLSQFKLPMALCDAKNIYGFLEFQKKKMIVPYKTMWNHLVASRLVIETSTICNWKCEFCPNTIIYRKPRFIDIELYKFILDEAVAYKSIKYVQIHTLNEPTLDDNFYKYVEEIVKRNLQLELYTNGSHLDSDKIN